MICANGRGRIVLSRQLRRSGAFQIPHKQAAEAAAAASKVAEGKDAKNFDPRVCNLDPTGQAARLLARQQREHLLALYITACNQVRKLRRLLLEGESPTGYGSPLTPLSPDEAEAVLRPAEEYLERLREFVAERAPEELAAHEAIQPEQNTRVWAANLLERLRQTADDLSERRLKRYGVSSPEDLARAEALRQRLTALVAEAVQELEHDGPSPTD